MLSALLIACSMAERLFLRYTSSLIREYAFRSSASKLSRLANNEVTFFITFVSHGDTGFNEGKLNTINKLILKDNLGENLETLNN